MNRHLQFSSGAHILGKRRSNLLQKCLKRPIIDIDGTIVDFELKSPFVYLYQQLKGQCSSDDRLNSSTLVALGAPPRGAPFSRRSSALKSSLEEFESPKDLNPISDIAAFLSSLQFEKRHLLETIPIYLIAEELK